MTRCWAVNGALHAPVQLCRISPFPPRPAYFAGTAKRSPVKQITSRAGPKCRKLQVTPGRLRHGAEPCGSPRSSCPKLQSGAGAAQPCPTPRGRALPSRRQKRHRNGRWALAPGAARPRASAAPGRVQGRDGDPGRGRWGPWLGEGWGPWTRRDGDAGQGGMGILDKEGWGLWARRDRDAGQGGTGILAKEGWGP